jgi:hypothetical protein
MTDTTTRAAGAAPRFAVAAHLDPLRSVQGVRSRYDCPDLTALDRHIASLYRRIITAGARSPDVVGTCRDDIDRLLDRRAWLTLPVAAQRRGPAATGPRAPTRMGP